MAGVNVWAQVGGVAGFLPMTALTGAAGQLLGMNAAATLAEWKAVKFLTNQLQNPAGTVATPSYTFSGNLGDGIYSIAAGKIGIALNGVQVARYENAAGIGGSAQLTLSSHLAMNGKLVEEAKSADIVAAALTDLGTATGNYLYITNAAGAINIASLGGDTLPAGTEIETKVVIAGGSVTFIYDANKINLPSAANLVAATGDIIRWRKTNSASPFWELVGFQRGLSTTGIATKGDLIVGTVSGGIVVPGIHSTAGNGKTLVSDSTQNDGLIWTDYSLPAMNINPNFLIDQIKEGGVYTQAGPGTTRCLDGISINVTNTAASISLQQVVDPDNAARKAVKFTINVADAVVDAADSIQVFLALEGLDVIDVSAGTVLASKVTVMLKHKLPAGTYGVSIINSAVNRSNVQVIVATGNEMDSPLPFTLDTVGVWLYNNGVGMVIRLCLMGGVNFQTPNLNQWQGANNLTSAAQFNFASNVANVGYIKKWHIVPGGVALAYAQPDIVKQLAQAQRQYDKTAPQGVAVGAPAGSAGALQADTPVGGTAVVGAIWQYHQTMRATPGTIVTYNPSAANANWRDVTNGVDRAVIVDPRAVSSDARIFFETVAAVQGSQHYIHATADARLA